MKRIFGSLVVTLSILHIATSTLWATTLEEVRQRGVVNCGVASGLPGFSFTDAQGNWTGLDTDVCRAVAAATLGDAEKVRFMPLTAKERLVAVQAGDVDLLAGNTTYTFTRDTSLGVHFAGISYYGTQGFLVKSGQNLESARDLEGAAVCVLASSAAELNVADFFKSNSLKYKPILSDTADQAARDFESGRCTALSADKVQLLGLQSKLNQSGGMVLLPETIAKDPVGPVVMQGDDGWYNIVKWSIYALVAAEELGLTAANVETVRNNPPPEAARLLGVTGIRGEGLGLPEDWAYQIIRQLGNYGEIFERNLGTGSELKVSRGINGLWSAGGLHYAPPIR